MSKRGRKRQLEYELNNLEEERSPKLSSSAQPSREPTYADEKRHEGRGDRDDAAILKLAADATAVQLDPAHMKQLKLTIVGQALNLVPPTFKAKRLTYIANILNQLDGTELVTEIEVNTLICDVKQIYGDSIKYLGTPATELLWKATFAKKISHMLFLGPPTETCFNCASPLQSHNPPSLVLCFGLQGPLPALKITLRCSHCCVNYRYTDA